MFNDPTGHDMDAKSQANAEPRTGSLLVRFTPIVAETRAIVDTETAAYHLNRQPQTLRIWASRENGPIRPVRINGRLAWSTAQIRDLLGLACKEAA